MTKLNLTPIYFGENATTELTKITKNYKKALLITGKTSIKRNGLYEDLKRDMGIPMVEFWGIKPNPTNTQIDEAAQFGIKNGIDLVIAAGGGSAIDAAKVIATMIANKDIKESWKLVMQEQAFTQTPIDIISIVTLAGTASENNAGSVITNEAEHQKRSVLTRAPILAIEDPRYTKSLSDWQTASGIFDCFSHITEQWFFVEKSFEWTDNYNIGLLKTLIENAEKIMVNKNYEFARDNLLFTSSMALNGLSKFNVSGGDWGVHCISHGITGNYDTTHGATLALVTPTYWKYMAHKHIDFKMRALKLVKTIWGVEDLDKGLEKLKDFIQMLKLPGKFSDFENIKTFGEDEITQCKISTNQPSHVSDDDVVQILSKIPK